MSSLKVNAGDLARAMRFAAQVVEKRNTILILSNVLLEAGADALAITTTDLDLQFRQDIPGACDAGFAVTVPAHRLLAIASAVKPEAQLNLAVEDKGRIVIRSGRGRWVLATLPREDFPAMIPPKFEAEITLASGDLASIINRVLPFRSTEQARYYLNGPLWHGEAGKLALVATDGHRLMRVVLDAAWPDDAPEVILAPKACKLMAALGEEAADIQLAWDSARIAISVGRISIIAKVIDGTFPDYRRVIGRRVDAPLRADPEVLRAALSHLLVAGDRPDSAVLIDPDDEGVTLSMRSSDALTDAFEEVICEVGHQPATAFNARYLNEILGAIGGDTVEIHQCEAGAPTLIVRVVDDGALGTVMPMRR